MSHLVDVAGIEPALPALGDIPPVSGQTISRPYSLTCFQPKRLGAL